MKTDADTSKVPYANLSQILIDSCKTVDPKAQFQIYKMYYKAMYNTSFRIINSTEEAEDIMQESFLSAFENIETYSGSVSFGTWLKKIVISRSIDFVSKERKVIFEDSDSGQKKVSNSMDDLTPESEIDFKVQDVKDAIKRLPDKYRIVISLHLFEGYDHEEIGEILSISPAASMSQFSMARQRLIKELRGN
jgi:RNA polymerase sigma factor (sigma-70 family)